MRQSRQKLRYRRKLKFRNKRWVEKKFWKFSWAYRHAYPYAQVFEALYKNSEYFLINYRQFTISICHKIKMFFIYVFYQTMNNGMVLVLILYRMKKKEYFNNTFYSSNPYHEKPHSPCAVTIPR